jgi:hypothetical protein
MAACAHENPHTLAQNLCFLGSNLNQNDTLITKTLALVKIDYLAKLVFEK